jgi:hypothetical protein
MINYLKRNVGSSNARAGRWVGDQVAELGMTRMAQALTHDSPVEVEYFWTPDEALEWLLDEGRDQDDG